MRELSVDGFIPPPSLQATFQPDASSARTMLAPKGQWGDDRATKSACPRASDYAALAK
jgi:hypothetical protein